VFSRVNQPLRYTPQLVGWYPVFVSWTEISRPLSFVSFFEKKWGIVLGYPNEDPMGDRDGLYLFKAEHVFVV